MLLGDNGKLRPIRVTACGATAAAKVAIVGWVEKRIAQRAGAIAFLESQGFVVTRIDAENSQIARYWVSSYRQEFASADIVVLAQGRGFVG